MTFLALDDVRWHETRARARSQYGTFISRRPGGSYQMSAYMLTPKWEHVLITPALLETYAQIIWREHQGWIDLRSIEVERCLSEVVTDERAGLLARLQALRGDGPLREDDRLHRAAYDQAIWIANTDQYLMHQRPDASTPLHRALDAHYNALLIDEIAYGSPQLDMNVAWHYWLATPRDSVILFDLKYQDVGAAVARGIWGMAWVILLARETTRNTFPRIRRKTA